MNHPKPIALKKLEGSYRKGRAPKNEITPTIELSLQAPKELNEWGSSYWVDIMTEYSKIGLVTKVDLGALHSLCMWYGLMREAQDIIDAKGLEVEVVKATPKGETYTVTETNPMIVVADKAFKNYVAMCREFGLTPASRVRISAPDNSHKDEFAEFD